MHNDNYEEIISKLFYIGIYGSKDEYPYFLNHFESIFSSVNSKKHVLGIERHKYNLKFNDSIMDVEEIIVKSIYTRRLTMKKDGQILVYNLPDGKSKVEVLLSEENIWMTQAALAELYQTSIPNINMHIKNIYKECELEEASTIKSDLIVQIEGNRKIKRTVKFYNLEMIIAIGFRVKSSVGNIFRKWANQTLKEYMTKGFAMDDERLKDSSRFGKDYFDELLLRIRAIRASEKRFYQKVLEIYATSVDYNSKDERSIEFFKIVQNKLHYAVSGETAAEIIYDRADSNKDNMGLTSFTGSKVQKDDVVIAKNYLSQQEITSLNRIVTMYLDYAEEMASEGVPMHMNDWINVLDEFLKFNRKDILIGSGKISHAIAVQKALKEYKKFDKTRIEKQRDLILPSIDIKDE